VKTVAAILATILAVAAATVITSSSATAAPTTPAAAHVSVHPSHGLDIYSVVTVSATGIAHDTTVNVIECDVPTTQTDDGAQGCAAIATPTTNARGALSVSLNAQDPVYRYEPFGDPVPIYCRADVCRFFVEWTSADGVLHSVATAAMHFKGSPATIAASPSTGLADETRVHVTGSAKGSSGRYVTIVEESCFQIIQGDACLGAIPLTTVELRGNDTYSASVPVFRYLGDGEDCVGSFYGCQLSVTVLNSDGEPDDTFGVSRLGQPNVAIAFAG
jgi:hypothetical protein